MDLNARKGVHMAIQYTYTLVTPYNPQRISKLTINNLTILRTVDLNLACIAQ